MLINLLGDLAIITVQYHPIFVLKTDIFDAYMNIHPRRMMASSLFIGS